MAYQHTNQERERAGSGRPEAGYTFIAHDPYEQVAVRWANWVAAQLPAGTPAILPRQTWTLGAWEHSLMQWVRDAQSRILILTPNFLATSDPFTCAMRQALLLDDPEAASAFPLLVMPPFMFAGEGERGQESPAFTRQEIRQQFSLLFTDRVQWVDLTPLNQAEEVARQNLLSWFGETAQADP